MTARSSASPCLVGIDIGTQSIRAMAFDTAGVKLAGAVRVTPITKMPTGGEHDPETILATVIEALTELGRALAGRPVAGLAIASFGESCVLVGENGETLAPAIAWFDRRTEAEGRALGERIGADRIFAITGHAVDTTLTLCKLAWIAKNWPEAARRAKTILMMSDWIGFRLTGEAATDPTLASRSLYFDIHRRQWSEELFAEGGLAAARPAALRPSGSSLGAVRPEILAATGLAGQPVVGVGGHDHLVGSLAAGLVAPGDVLDSLGTSEAALLLTAAPMGEPEVLRCGYFQGAIATDREMSYLGGGIYSSGGAIEWFRRLVGNPPHAELIAEAEAVPAGSNGIAFLPHLANAPPPDLDPHARGAFVGLTGEATRGVLFRAVLEGLSLQARMMVDGMVGLGGTKAPDEILIIGGGSRNRLHLAIKADVFARPLRVIDEAEATALGAALLGGLAAGLWPSLDAALRDLDRPERIVEPGPGVARYAALRAMAFENIHARLLPINRGLARFVETGTPGAG